MTIKTDIKQFYDFWFNMELIYEEWSKKYGITSNALFALYIIKENPGTCTQQLISKQLRLPKQTVNSVLSSLTASGYVEKLPSKEDKRSKILAFTAKGEAYAEEILSKLYRFEESALYNMSPEERSGMLTNCKKFLENLQNAFYGKEE